MTDSIEKTRLTLANLSEETSYHETRDGVYWSFTFAVAPGSDYRFLAALYLDNGEVQISARRLDAPEGEYFWYMAYEPVAYESLEQIPHL